MLAITTTPALAGNFTGITGSTACNMRNVMETTNSAFTYYRSSLEAPMYAATAWNITNNVSPTDLVAVAHSQNTSSTGILVTGPLAWNPPS